MSEKDFEIHISDTNVDTGSIPISWCLSKKTLMKLKACDFKNPYVVICIAPADNYDSKKEYRKAVPLKDLMAYVSFRFPGPTNIFAFITNKYENYLDKTLGRYDTSILNCFGSDFTGYVKNLFGNDVVKINVPKECFASEPSELEKTWVNYCFSEKAVDQCHFRQRRLFAYTIQPLLAVFNLVIRLSMLMFAMGILSIGLKHRERLFKPFTYSLYDCMSVIDKPYFIKDEYNIKTFANTIITLIKVLITMTLTPIVLLPLAILTIAFGALVVIETLSQALLVTIVATILIFLIRGDATTQLIRFFKRNGPNGPIWYAEPEVMLALICDGTAKPMKVSLLPKKHRTIKLRMSEFKAMVCRPFAG